MPASILPSQIGAIVGTVAQGVQTGMTVAQTVQKLASTFGSLGSIGETFGPEDATDAKEAVKGNTESLRAAAAVPFVGKVVAGIGESSRGVQDFFEDLARVSSKLEDKFHPMPEQAAEWLRRYRIDPGLLFVGATSAEKAARLIRYLKLVSGEQPMQKSWTLENPVLNPANLDKPGNPYQGEVDPSDAMTDPEYLKPIHDMVWRTKKALEKWDENAKGVVHEIPAIVTRETAQRLLALVRYGFDKSRIDLQSMAAAARERARIEVKALRQTAGESGPDDYLSELFGSVDLPDTAA